MVFRIARFEIQMWQILVLERTGGIKAVLLHLKFGQLRVGLTSTIRVHVKNLDTLIQRGSHAKTLNTSRIHMRASTNSVLNLEKLVLEMQPSPTSSAL